MTETYSVIAAFGTNGDAEDAVQRLERSGIQKNSMSIEKRVSPIPDQQPALGTAASQLKTWTITGALWGGVWALLTNEDRFLRKSGTVVSVDPFVSYIGAMVKGAGVFASVSFIHLSMNGGFLRPHLEHDEPTLSVDPHLLVVHGTPAAINLAGDVLRTAQSL
jgi:hypothetical protein